MLFRNLDTNEMVDCEELLNDISSFGTLRNDYILVSMEERKVCNFRRKQKPTITDYVNKCKEATEKCIQILHPQNVNRNIFCPYHENKQTSKTPSGKFFVKTNTFKCFSTKCKKKANSMELLAYLERQR